MIKIKDILKIGDVFNNFIVIDIEPIIIDRRQQIRVKCTCGHESYIRPDRLISGQTKSCYNCASIKRKGKYTTYYGEICSKYYSDVKRNAKNRGLNFDISMKDMWELYLKQKSRCALTNLPITIEKYAKLNQKFIYKKITASLDRIDPKKGYEVDNIQWVHKWVNVMKGSMSNECFIFLCNKVAEFSDFKYDNFEPSLMEGWLPRYINRKNHDEGATTSQ